MIRLFFEFFCHSQLKESDLNPENNSLLTCTELLTLQIQDKSE
jgi:hypothetical protein